MITDGTLSGSFFNTRVNLGPFFDQAGKRSEKGIRVHSAFTAFFLNVFSKITEFKAEDGTTLYLNNHSYIKWFDQKKAIFKNSRQGCQSTINNLEGTISKYGEILKKNSAEKMFSEMNERFSNKHFLLQLPLIHQAFINATDARNERNFDEFNDVIDQLDKIKFDHAHEQGIFEKQIDSIKAKIALLVPKNSLILVNIKRLIFSELTELCKVIDTHAKLILDSSNNVVAELQKKAEENVKSGNLDKALVELEIASKVTFSPAVRNRLVNEIKFLRTFDDWYQKENHSFDRLEVIESKKIFDEKLKELNAEQSKLNSIVSGDVVEIREIYRSHIELLNSGLKFDHDVKKNPKSVKFIGVLRDLKAVGEHLSNSPAYIRSYLINYQFRQLSHHCENLQKKLVQDTTNAQNEDSATEAAARGDLEASIKLLYLVEQNYKNLEDKDRVRKRKEGLEKISEMVSKFKDPSKLLIIDNGNLEAAVLRKFKGEFEVKEAGAKGEVTHASKKPIVDVLRGCLSGKISLLETKSILFKGLSGKLQSARTKSELHLLKTNRDLADDLKSLLDPYYKRALLIFINDNFDELNKFWAMQHLQN